MLVRYIIARRFEGNVILRTRFYIVPSEGGLVENRVLTGQTYFMPWRRIDRIGVIGGDVTVGVEKVIYGTYSR